jgi:S1-C subfamily serine protease
MKINKDLKKKINKCVVRIIAEQLRIDWNMPYVHQTPLRGQGTGFFINNKGHILTCAHVVNGARNIYIEIPNISSDKFQCDVISICPKFDIALLQCKDYYSKEYLELGNSDKLEVGMEVQVVGYPTSLLNSKSNSNNIKYTIGIIAGQQSGLIQTDSAINPGNSGGPLLCNNKVIGINSQKLVGYAVDNISYSVPINYYNIFKNNIDQKIVYRPSLLLEYNNTDKKILEDLTNKKIKSGIIIAKIYDQSILKKTNIKEGDIITQLGKYKLDNFGLTSNYKWLGTNININVLLNLFKNDEKIKIKYFDFKEKKIKSCVVILTPFIKSIRTLYPAFEEIPYFIFGGIVFSNLSQNFIAANMDHNIDLLCLLTNNEESMKPKVCITTILNKKINILNNIHNGDIISKVNDIEVDTIKNLENALKKPLIINKQKYIKIENNNSKSILINVKDLLEEDKHFSNLYSYPLTNIYNNL